MTFEEILLKYGLPIVVMAVIVMVLVGIIKIFTKMIPGRESKPNQIMSHIYAILAPVFSAGIVCAYHAIFKIPFEWQVIIGNISGVWSCSQVLYPLYRDLGGRALCAKILSLFKGKSKKADEIIAMLDEVMVLTTKQKETIKEKLEK